MKFIDNIKNFLYAKESFFCQYDNKVYVYNFTDLPIISDQIIKIKFNNKIIHITGERLKVLKLEGNEVLISGEYTKIEVINE